MDSAEKLRRALAEDWEFVGDPNSLCQLLRLEVLKLREALQRIALLADSGSKEHKERFCSNGEGDGIANGWRVAEAMREHANDVVGSLPLKGRFKRFDRVRVRFGRDRGHYGTIRSVGGDDGTYYGVKLDCHDAEMGYSEYELEGQNPLKEPIAPEDESIYRRAMESMAAQFIHPKMTARELAELQLKGEACGKS